MPDRATRSADGAAARREADGISGISGAPSNEADAPSPPAWRREALDTSLPRRRRQGPKRLVAMRSWVQPGSIWPHEA